MSIFNFTNRFPSCQKGFLLLEALCTLGALTVLMFAVASWYTNAARTQRFLRERLHALAIADSYSAQWQSARQVPSAGNFIQDTYKMLVQVQQDSTQKDFHWVKITVKHPQTEQILVELLTGVAGGAP